MIAKMFLLVLLLHFVADYTLQGCLANMKQRKWWHDEMDKMRGKNGPKPMWFDRFYAYDWICGLACHAIYWTLVTYAPLLLLANSVSSLAWIVCANAIAHALIDHAKCNLHQLNLIQDQLLHLLQMSVTVAMFCI